MVYLRVSERKNNCILVDNYVEKERFEKKIGEVLSDFLLKEKISHYVASIGSLVFEDIKFLTKVDVEYPQIDFTVIEEDGSFWFASRFTCNTFKELVDKEYRPFSEKETFITRLPSYKDLFTKIILEYKPENLREDSVVIYPELYKFFMYPCEKAYFCCNDIGYKTSTRGGECNFSKFDCPDYAEYYVRVYLPNDSSIRGLPIV